MSTINPKVIDLSHYDKVLKDFSGAYGVGIRGVIHKATEGSNIVDKSYDARRFLAKQGRMLWGAYHFIRPGDPAAQVKAFLDVAQPDSETLLALDYEVSSVSLANARTFIEHLEQTSGRSVVVYSGNTIKEKLGNMLDPWWGAHRLWLAQYSRNWTVQRSWLKPWLWQYTGDGSGPEPHGVPGIIPSDALDISSYIGTDAELATEWSGADIKQDAPLSTPLPDPGPVPHPDGFWVKGITMTEWGGPDDDQTSAYGGTIDPDIPSVALPYHFHGTLPHVMVLNPANQKMVSATVRDVGPHYTDDPYWVPPGRRPRAEGLGGNHAGLDGTKALHDALGIHGAAGTRTATVDFRLM